MDTAHKIQELEGRVEKLEQLFSIPGNVSAAKQKKQSVKEFLMTKTLKSDIQKVAALAYFIEHIEKSASFNTADLEVAFRAAKEKLPTNMNDAVNKNIAKGFLMEAEERKDSKKAWCLTSTGEHHVEFALNK
jgi:hypothetical protein